MFLIDRRSELPTETLSSILNKFREEELPKLQRYLDYYRGKQNILQKQPSESTKPCNRIVVNYCKPIADNYTGYIAGKPITYSSNENIDALRDILNYNDVAAEDIELLRQALIYGRSFEIVYLDEESKERFKVLDTRECIPIYSNTLDAELLYVVRFYEEDIYAAVEEKNYIVEVYDSSDIYRYRSNSSFTTFDLLDIQEHHFKQVPITVFTLNADSESIFGQVLTLQDAYNNLVSGEADDFDSWADAYLVLKGCTAEDNDLMEMKRNRCLILDTDAEVSYLTKSINDTQIQNMLQNLNDKIHKISNSPDFSDEKFFASTGIALRLKLIGFENTAADIVSEMKKALQKRIELLCEILSLTDSESTWRDIKITFTRNLPMETENIVASVNALRGLVSTKTLLGQLPFIEDPEEELDKLKEENSVGLGDIYGGLLEDTRA